MDYLESPLNPCSVESISSPIDNGHGESVWPVMVACYELQEDNTRRGYLDLYRVKVPDSKTTGDESPLSLEFGPPQNILGASHQTQSAGILDGKWCIPQDSLSNKLWYASAHSSGEILIHSIPKTPSADSGTETGQNSHANLVGKCAPVDENSSALCLSLNWDLGSSAFSSQSRIISSYSDGHVALHTVDLNHDQVHFNQEESWQAHKLFTNPAEVWTACFSPSDRNVVLTGGDEGYLKVWDIRCIAASQPMHILKHFEAGVTALSPHPRRENLVACGSYDETLALYDLRYLSLKQGRRNPLCHSDALGGGIWRIKWHPYDDNSILLAAMHGGCRVVYAEGMQAVAEEAGDSAPKITVRKEFVKHKSMAYGADWLVYRRPDNGKYCDAAASCSFYDRALYLWNASV